MNTPDDFDIVLPAYLSSEERVKFEVAWKWRAVKLTFEDMDRMWGARSAGANTVIWPPPAVCDHPMALLQVTDNMAFCDGCGRTFELRQLGGST